MTQKLKKTLLGLLGVVTLGACASQQRGISKEDELRVLAETPTKSERVYNASMTEFERPELNYGEKQKQKLEDAVQIDVDRQLKSKYVDSGFLVTDNPVLQSSLTLESPRYLPGFSFNLWTSKDLEGRTRDITEVDYRANYSTNVSDNLQGTIAFSAFDFSHGEFADSFNTSYEAEVSLSTSNLPLDVTLIANQIFGKGSGDGRLYQTSIGKTLDLTELLGLENVLGDNGLSVSGNASVFFNDNYFTQGSGFSHIEGSIGINADLGDGFNIFGGYMHQIPLSNNFPDGTFENLGVWNAGVSYTTSF
jgi:hypothetical protein